MIVCNEIDDGLWQAGAEWLPDTLPDVDVIIHAVPLPHDLWAMSTHPPTTMTPRIFVPFGDHDHAPMNEAVWDSLRALAKVHAHRRVLTVCSQGKNRSGLMSALILIERGLPVEDAIQRVKERGSDPGTVEALSNREFLRRLRA